MWTFRATGAIEPSLLNDHECLALAYFQPFTKNGDVYITEKYSWEERKQQINNQTLGCLRKTPTSSSEFYGDSRMSGWTRLTIKWKVITKTWQISLVLSFRLKFLDFLIIFFSRRYEKSPACVNFATPGAWRTQFTLETTQNKQQACQKLFLKSIAN